MLAKFCVEVADLQRALCDTLAQGREANAREIADQIAELEGQILSIPGSTLKDAAVKLQILKLDLDENMTESQRWAFEDALSIVSARSVN